VPFGQAVAWSWSTKAWLPLTPALVQQPSITPELLTGFPAMAAPAAVPPATNARAVATVITMLRSLMVVLPFGWRSWPNATLVGGRTMGR
jgi:hypothetical protein